jgi:starch-binding outer membrane protein, SusD/RagB family
MPEREMNMKNRLEKRRFRLPVHLALAGLVVVATAGCDSFFEVRNPDIVNADDVDPVQDGTVFSRSAFQTFATSYGDMIRHTAWFSNEAWVGDTFPTRNEFGRRAIDDRNGTHLVEVWVPLTRSISQAEQAMEVLEGEPGQELNIARAAMTSAFALTLMGEAFCEGTMVQSGLQPGPLMTPQQLLENAVTRYDRAIATAGGLTGAEAPNILNASRVGKGRALLQLGRGADAVSAVQGVAPDFEFLVPYVDDPGNRGRLGNGVYFFSAGGSRESFVVPPHYRAIGQDLTGDPADPPGDPRIQFYDSGRNGQDNTLRLWSQLKYPHWAAAIRLASGLEARYIAVEARNDPVEMRAFINERRAVGGQGPYDGDDLLGELMTQRSRDFWLEGKRMGDWRRNPNHVPNIIQPGPNYYKPEVGEVFTQTCFPLPFNERNNNPNIS